MPTALLAIVGVARAARVVCQAQGCGHGVYRRIHVVQHDDASLGVYGSDCFERLFGDIFQRPPRYGVGDGREFTDEERRLLAENTEQLIAKFEAEYQTQLEQLRLRRERERHAAADSRAQPKAQSSLTPAQLAAVELRAKALVRKKFGVDPDLPGWRGLVAVEVRKRLAQ